MPNLSKIGVVGAGNVGAAIVNALVLRNIGREIVLYNREKEKAIAEAMDIDDTVPLLSEMSIKATDRYEDLSGCGVIIVTIGARQEEGESRLELLGRNAKITKSVIKELDRVSPDSVILMVTNPVDILTRVAQETSVRQKRMIFGSGTVLDTSRLRYQLGKALQVNRKNVHVHVVGEHGDGEFAVWSSAIVGSVRLDEFPLPQGIDLKVMKDQMMESVRTRAYEIIERKGYTNYGVAVAVAKLVQCVIRDERKIFSVSVGANEEYELRNGIVLSLPCVISNKGIEHRLILTCDTKEKALLKKAAENLDNAYHELKNNLNEKV